MSSNIYSVENKTENPNMTRPLPFSYEMTQNLISPIASEPRYLPLPKKLQENASSYDKCANKYYHRNESSCDYRENKYERINTSQLPSSMASPKITEDSTDFATVTPREQMVFHHGKVTDLNICPSRLKKSLVSQLVTPKINSNVESITPNLNTNKKRSRSDTSADKNINNVAVKNSRVQRNSGTPNPHKRKKMYSDYVGVTFNKTHNKYQACITHFRKQHYLGRYRLAVDAAKAYDESAKTLKGDGWKVNFSSEKDFEKAKKAEIESICGEDGTMPQIAPRKPRIRRKNTNINTKNTSTLPTTQPVVNTQQVLLMTPAQEVHLVSRSNSVNSRSSNENNNENESSLVEINQAAQTDLTEAASALMTLLGGRCKSRH